MPDKIFLEQLEAECRIGIFDWERKIRQKIMIDLELPAHAKRAARHDRIQDTLDYKAVAKHVLEFVSESEFFLIETLAQKLSESLFKKFPFMQQVKIKLSKPGAIRGAKNVGIEIQRRRA